MVGLPLSAGKIAVAEVKSCDWCDWCDAPGMPPSCYLSVMSGRAARYSAHMLRIGLTGGIGSGKSTVSALLAARGAVVIDADRIAREVVAPVAAHHDGADVKTGHAVEEPDEQGREHPAEQHRAGHASARTKNVATRTSTGAVALADR